MNEMVLDNDIKTAIKNGEYDKFLRDAEVSLEDFIKQYNLTDALVLINRAIIYSNINMFYKENDYDKYERDKHISLRILFALPEMCYRNRGLFLGNNIIDYNKSMEELINKIRELEYIYYYFPVRKNKEFVWNDENRFYMNYFRAYYFDFPIFQLDEFISFFNQNMELCKRELEDSNFEKSLSAMLFFLQIENNIVSDKTFLGRCIWRIWSRKLDFTRIHMLYPIGLVKVICLCKGINYRNLINMYVYDEENDLQESKRIIEMIANLEHKKIMVRTSNFLFLPRNYYFLYRLYNKVWRGKEFSKNNKNGKTYKSQNHESEIFTILQKYFGEHCVYENVFLKRKSGGYAEKDCIVVYKDVLLSFEAKSNLLPSPELDIYDGISDIKSKCLDAIRKAYEQSLEVKQAVLDDSAVFYDSDRKRNKIVLNLKKREIKECIQIVVVYEEFLNIETNIEKILPEFDGWIVDVKSLQYILDDTIGRGNNETFFEYVRRRKNAYGLIEVQSGEEIRMYEHYKKFPFFYEHNRKGKGISIHI